MISRTNDNLIILDLEKKWNQLVTLVSLFVLIESHFIFLCIDLCSVIMPFVLLSDIFDLITLSQCEIVFYLVEEKLPVWKTVSGTHSQLLYLYIVNCTHMKYETHVVKSICSNYFTKHVICNSVWNSDYKNLVWNMIVGPDL